MTRPRMLVLAAALPLALSPSASAQSLARRIGAAGDGPVSFTFAARPGVCGDGANFIRDGFGGSRIVDGDFDGYRRGRGNDESCRRGPVRVVATVAAGEVVRLRSYAGTPRASGGAHDLGDVPVREAVAWLGDLAERAAGRVAADAIFPLVLADSTTPWPELLRVARDRDRPRASRREAGTWLGHAAASRLGLTSDDDAEKSDDAQVREAAVFGLSQLPPERAIPQLIAVARSARHPESRADALFWLGQSADERALDLFEEMLRQPK